MTEKIEERDELTSKVIGAAIEVHRALGHGLLESSYRECLQYELNDRGICVQKEVIMPITYKGRVLKKAYRLDLLVEGQLIVELKALDRTIAAHEVQILTYLRLSGLKRGLLLNFYAPTLKQGIHRFVM